MITDSGKVFIKRFMVGQSGALAEAISIGVGDTPATLSDDRMEFELTRTEVLVTDYDFINDYIVFKAELPVHVVGEIREIGLWTSEVNSAAGNQESKILTTFDSETEDWDTSAFISTYSRLGTDSLHHTPAASAVSSNVMTGANMDFMDYTSADQFVIAYYVGNTNCASMEIRLRTDELNYYKFIINAPQVGYHIDNFVMSGLTPVGNPNWDDINEIEVVTTSAATGAADVHYDGLRIDDMDSVDPEYGLIARYVLQVPEIKEEGIVKDIEYALSLTISG